MSLIQSKTLKTGFHESGKVNIGLISASIALLFHFSGAIGMFSPFRSWFIDMTPVNLILMGLLIVLNNDQVGQLKLIKIFILAYVAGFLSEVIGVNTGYLFGNYSYGNALGIKIAEVPVMIGFLWFMTIYGIGNLVLFIKNRYSLFSNYSSLGSTLILANFAALLTTLFDIILEPAAILLGYWSWENGSVPIYNYLCWYLVSGLIYLFYFQWYQNNEYNKFAVVLIILQLIFFVLVSISGFINFHG
ncbi:MAG: carotenoid biosynthesis protein [Saprospiraceae bacterium]|nr:carotenoid biosynthesis protein [Saprospiraceae bacterium]